MCRMPQICQDGGEKYLEHVHILVKYENSPFPSILRLNHLCV